MRGSLRLSRCCEGNANVVEIVSRRRFKISCEVLFHEVVQNRVELCKVILAPFTNLDNLGGLALRDLVFVGEVLDALEGHDHVLVSLALMLGLGGLNIDDLNPPVEYLLDLFHQDDVMFSESVHLVLGKHVILELLEDLSCVVFRRPTLLLPNDKARQGIGCFNSSLSGLFFGGRAPSAHQDLILVRLLVKGVNLGDLLCICALCHSVRFSCHLIWIA